MPEMSLSTRNRLRSVLLAAGLAAFALAILAPSALARYAYTVNYTDETVSAINTQTNQVVGAPIPVGSEPYAIAITPDGKTAYVANYTEETVTAIDTQTNQVVGSIQVGEGPYAIAITPDGKTAYVVNYEEETVVRIDTATNQVVGAPIPVGSEPSAIAITPDGKTAYVVSYEEESVWRIDTQTNQVVGSPIPVGEGPIGIAITPDGKTAYVVNKEEETVTVIDTATNQAVGSPIPVGEGPTGIAIAPDGKTAYVVNEGDDDIAVIDTQTNQVVGSPITVGSAPYAVAFTADGKTAYVADYGSDEVSVVNAQTRQAESPISVAGGPWQLAIQPDQPPAASFAVGGAPLVGSPLAFNGTASSDPDGSIVRYDWSFGDGQTALDAGPLVSHAYKAPGTYLATLKATDAEGCSIGFVFTGQTAYCNGSAVAVKTQAVTVSYPSNRFRFGKIKRNRRNGTARLQIKVPGPGVLVLRGKKVRYVKHKATKAGSTFLTVRPKIRLNKALKRRHHVKVKVRVTFTPTGGKTSAKSKSLKLIRR